MTNNKTILGGFAWFLVATTLAGLAVQPVPADASTTCAAVKSVDGTATTFA